MVLESVSVTSLRAPCGSPLGERRELGVGWMPVGSGVPGRAGVWACMAHGLQSRTGRASLLPARGAFLAAEAAGEPWAQPGVCTHTLPALSGRGTRPT